jgi:dienelactone hydrolase
MPTRTGSGASTRRRFLGFALAGAVAALAGCSAGDDGGSETPTATTGMTTTRTADTTRAATTTTDATTTTTEGTTPREARSLATTVVERLGRREYDAVVETFSETLAERLPAARLEAVWERQAWIVGGYADVGDVAHERSDGNHAVEVTVRGNYGLLGADVAVAGDRSRVVGLYFSTKQDGSYSPPAYADREAFEERSVTVDADAGCPLPGTASVPADRDGPVPGVVLVHGSGPADRDQSIGPQKPFRDLAWGLATRGVAVLRYRKRTAECSAPPEKLTPDWVAVEDAVTAVDVLRSVPEVRDDAVAVLGHSLGGFLGPRIANRADGAAGLALLAAPGRSVWRSNLYQYRQVVAFDGELSDEEKSQIRRLERLGERIDEGGFPDDRQAFGQTGAFWTAVVDYDQVAVARDLSTSKSSSIPVAVHQAERDVQVHPEKSARAWREGLSDVSKAKADVRTRPRLDHLFLPRSGPSYVGRYYTEPENVARSVVEALSGWVRGPVAGRSD